MTARRVVLALVLASACAVAAEAKSFRDLFRGTGPVPSPTIALGDALTDTVARSLPVVSAAPGITFRYDTSSGAFERDTELLGQLYLERARTIGRGTWNVMASYQHVHVDSVQGLDTDGLRDTNGAIVTSGMIGGRRRDNFVQFDRYAFDLTVDMVTLAATFGITDRIDVNLTLPILASRLALDARERISTFDPNGGLDLVGRERTSADLSHAGVGDLLLRGKYHVLARPWGDVAAGLVLRLPAGSRDDFQGTGTWELSPLVYASTRRIPLGGPFALQAFLNGGVDLDVTDVDLSEGRYGAGVDLAIANRATLSLAFLGREPFHGFTSAGFFDQPRLYPRNNTCQPRANDPDRIDRATCPMAPLFGLETVRPSYYSLSLGGRVSLWRDTVFGFANVLIPLNDRGIHTDPIPLVGFEATF